MTFKNLFNHWQFPKNSQKISKEFPKNSQNLISCCCFRRNSKKDTAWLLLFSNFVTNIKTKKHYYDNSRDVILQKIKISIGFWNFEKNCSLMFNNHRTPKTLNQTIILLIIDVPYNSTHSNIQPPSNCSTISSTKFSLLPTRLWYRTILKGRVCERMSCKESKKTFLHLQISPLDQKSLGGRPASEPKK